MFHEKRFALEMIEINKSINEQHNSDIKCRPYMLSWTALSLTPRSPGHAEHCPAQRSENRFLTKIT